MVHASRGRLDAAGRRPARARWRSSAGSRRRRARRGDAASTGPALAADYDRIRDHIARVVPGFDDYERACAGPAASPCRNPPRDSRTFPTATGRARFTVNPLEVLTVPAGPAAAADHPQPRPVQHHDLRARRPLPGHPATGAGWCSSTPTTSPSSGFADGEVVDVVVRVARRRPRRARRLPRSSPTPRPGARARPTSPRPTCSCRSTAPPRSAAPPPRSRSSSASSAAPAEAPHPCGGWSGWVGDRAG